MDVPVQFFQSTVAIELAVSATLLWEIRFFERGSGGARDRAQLPDARLQLLFVLVLGATLFGRYGPSPRTEASWRRPLSRRVLPSRCSRS
jgi:hypothetical protein